LSFIIFKLRKPDRFLCINGKTHKIVKNSHRTHRPEMTLNR